MGTKQRNILPGPLESRGIIFPDDLKSIGASQIVFFSVLTINLWAFFQSHGASLRSVYDPTPREPPCAFAIRSSTKRNVEVNEFELLL